MQKLTVNGKQVSIDVDPETPLLWVVRDALGLKGTKFGCGKGLCGSCTVHVGGQATRSCVLPVAGVTAEVTTIEGLAADSPVKRAWTETDVPQCGYCQPGQMMACASLLKSKAGISGADVVAAMTNLCRCGSYPKIRKACTRAAELASGGAK